jgi:GDP-L-fucose synthase
MSSKNIFVAGHNGMVGSALIRSLGQNPKNNILKANRSELDLTNQKAVNQFFQDNSIDEVYIAAAKVGGIFANSKYPADFIYTNLMIEANIINAAHKSDIQKLLFLGSSCIYPKYATQPMSEEDLLTGSLEPTNEPYAIAKIAGIKLCESYNRQFGRDYRSVMPTNLYGPNDNFDPNNSHVIPALLRRFHEAKERGDDEIVVWGSGKAKREFLYVDDMASASIHVMDLDIKVYEKSISPMSSHINIGTGLDCSILELTKTLKKTTGYSGNVKWDRTKPDGTPRKLMNVDTLAKLGWKSKVSLEEGLDLTYSWYINSSNVIRL